MNMEDMVSQNPWWKNPGWEKDDRHLKQLQKYHYVYHRNSYLPSKPGVIVVYGPRQVGKTTLLKQTIAEKVKIGGKSEVFYLNAENLRDRFELYETVKTAEALYHVKYLFLDEISAIKDWERTIKALVDEGIFDEKNIVLAGSSSINIMKKAERLPGRMAEGQYRFRYYPLSFREVAELYGITAKNPNEAIAQLNKLNPILYNYFLHGGFIRAINAFYETKLLDEDLFSIYSAWIDGELARIKRSPETATHILDGIALALTNEISWSSLAKGINHVTVADYVETLRDMFVLDYLEKSRRAGQGAAKNKKIYFSDPFLYWTALFKARKINAIGLADLDSVTMGKLAEGATYSNLVQYIDRKTGMNDFDVRRYLYFEKERSGETDFILKFGQKRYKIECKFGKIGKEREGRIYLTRDTLAENKVPLAVFLMFHEASFELL